MCWERLIEAEAPKPQAEAHRPQGTVVSFEPAERPEPVTRQAPELVAA